MKNSDTDVDSKQKIEENLVILENDKDSFIDLTTDDNKEKLTVTDVSRNLVILKTDMESFIDLTSDDNKEKLTISDELGNLVKVESHLDSFIETADDIKKSFTNKEESKNETKNSFTCDFCKAHLPDNTSLEEHINKSHKLQGNLDDELAEIEDTINLYQCEECDSIHDSQSLLEEHKRQHHSLNTINHETHVSDSVLLEAVEGEALTYINSQCPVCLVCFSSTSQFENHVLRLHGQDLHEELKNLGKFSDISNGSATYVDNIMCESNKTNINSKKYSPICIEPGEVTPGKQCNVEKPDLVEGASKNNNSANNHIYIVLPENVPKHVYEEFCNNVKSVSNATSKATHAEKPDIEAVNRVGGIKDCTLTSTPSSSHNTTTNSKSSGMMNNHREKAIFKKRDRLNTQFKKTQSIFSSERSNICKSEVMKIHFDEENDKILMDTTSCNKKCCIEECDEDDGFVCENLSHEHMRCKECLICYKNYNALNVHVHLHRNLFKCNDCGKVFQDLYNFKLHKLTHPAGNQHICENCGKQFKTNELKEIHETTKCKKINVLYTCNKCGKSFASLDLLKKHFVTHKEKFKCLICHTDFDDMEGIKKHMRLHTNMTIPISRTLGRTGHKSQPLLFTCKHCGISFLKRDKLDEHLKVHRNVQMSTNTISAGISNITTSLSGIPATVSTMPSSASEVGAPIVVAPLPDVVTLESALKTREVMPSSEVVSPNPGVMSPMFINVAPVTYLSTPVLASISGNPGPRTITINPVIPSNIPGLSSLSSGNDDMQEAEEIPDECLICEHCSEWFSDEAEFAKHMFTVHDVEYIKSEKEDESSIGTSGNDLVNNISKTNFSSMLCNICGDGYYNKEQHKFCTYNKASALDTKSKHVPEDCLVCENCGDWFSNEAEFAKHMFILHDVEYMAQCEREEKETCIELSGNGSLKSSETQESEFNLRGDVCYGKAQKNCIAEIPATTFQECDQIVVETHSEEIVVETQSNDYLRAQDNQFESTSSYNMIVNGLSTNVASQVNSLMINSSQNLIMVNNNQSKRKAKTKQTGVPTKRKKTSEPAKNAKVIVYNLDSTKTKIVKSLKRRN